MKSLFNVFKEAIMEAEGYCARLSRETELNICLTFKGHSNEIVDH